MKRSLAVFLAMIVPLVFAVDAGAKVALEKAEVCTASGCETHAAGPNEFLPFELFGPTVQIGRRTPPPAQSDGSRYRITFFTRPVPRGSERFAVDYFPDAGYLRVLGERGAEAGGAMLNTGWVRLSAGERRAYDRLTTGPASSGPDTPSESSDGGGAPLGVIGAVIAVLALGALAFVVALRRRSQPNLSRAAGG